MGIRKKKLHKWKNDFMGEEKRNDMKRKMRIMQGGKREEKQSKRKGKKKQ